MYRFLEVAGMVRCVSLSVVFRTVTIALVATIRLLHVARYGLGESSIGGLCTDSRV